MSSEQGPPPFAPKTRPVFIWCLVWFALISVAVAIFAVAVNPIELGARSYIEEVDFEGSPRQRANLVGVEQVSVRDGYYYAAGGGPRGHLLYKLTFPRPVESGLLGIFAQNRGTVAVSSSRDGVKYDALATNAPLAGFDSLMEQRCMQLFRAIGFDLSIDVSAAVPPVVSARKS